MEIINLEKTIIDLTATLFNLAKEATFNSLSPECRYILSEIKDANFNDVPTERKLRIKENNLKTPKSLLQIIPEIQAIYHQIYDLNLFVFKATQEFTIIDIRYYAKSSLDNEYGQKIIKNSPMLHCKITLPPWHSTTKKFDINWEHLKGVNKLKMLRWKLSSRL